MQSGDQASGRDAMETDADGFRIDHRSETEQSGRTKEVHEYADRTEFRLRDEKEVRLEEVRTRETTRPATYDEILALLEAQFDGLEEIESGGGSREVTVVEMNRRETARERAAAAGGERTREITITDEKRREEIVEGPRESKRQVVTERETTVVNPRGGELRLLREETSPPMASIDIALIEPPPTPRDQQERLNFGAAAVGGTPPGSVDFRLGGTPQEVPRPSSEARYSLNVPSAADYYPAAAEGTGSLHRIQHRKHLIEELIVEDIDTFYEDQTKPPKKKRPLLKRKDKPETIETPPATLGRPSRPASTRPDGEEGHRGQEVLTLQGSAGQASLPQTAVAYPSYPHSNLGVGGMGDRPRSTTVGGNDDSRADDNSVTFVVSYDHPFGAKRAERRKKDVHPNKKKKEKKKKEKLRSGRGDHSPKATDGYDRPGQSITYIVNYEPSRPFDAEPTEYVPRSGAVAAARLAEIPVPKDDSRRTSENLTIEVDMSAGDVKVSEPPTKHTETRTFSASYELPDRSVVAAAPSKIRYEPPRHPPPHPPSSPTDPANYRLSQNQGMTYVVNYDLPKRLPSRIESELEGSSAPTYSVTVGGDEPETKPVKEKKPKATKNDPYEITYVVDYGAGGRGDVTTDDDRVKGQPVRPGGESAEVRFRSPTVKGKDGAVPETITYVAEHEIETRGRGTLPKSTNVASPSERNDSTHTYIVNYELPQVQGERPHKKRGKGSRPDVEPEPVELTKWSDLPDSSSELKFSVHHEAPEIAAKFKEPVSKKTSVPSAKPKDLPGEELVFRVDHSLPKPKKQSSEFSTEADLPFPDVRPTFTEQSRELVFQVDYPWPEPVPEHHPIPRESPEFQEASEELVFSVDYPLPEPRTKPVELEPISRLSFEVEHPIPRESPEFQETSEELVFNVDYPLPEPRTKPVELEPISRLSFEVEHPIPKRDVPEPDEDLVFEVDYPEPEPVIKPEESISGLAITVEHPFPKRRSEIEDASHEFSISIETPSKESRQKPDIYNSDISADIPSSITKPELELPKHAEEYSITVEHSLPKPHAAEHAVETKGQKLPVLPVPPSGDSVTYVVTYEEPTLARQQAAAKEKKKHGKRTTKNKESLSAAVNDTSPEAGETITYIVNYNEPSTGLEESDGFDSMPTQERQAGQPAKYSGRQTQDEPGASRKAVQPPSGSITYTVDYGVIPAGKAPRGKTKREGPSDIERLEAEIRHETLPPIAAPDLTITVGHPEYNLTRQQESTTDSLTYIVNHDQPFNVGKTKKAKPSTETQTYTFIVNTAEPSIPVQPTSTSVAAHSQNIHAQTPEGEIPSYDITVSRPEPVTIASSSTPKDFNKHAQEQLTVIVNHDLPSRVRLEAAKNGDFHQLETSQIKQIDQQASIKFDESDIGRFKAGTNIAAEESITYIVKSDESTGQVITDKDYRATKETLKSSHIVAPNIATGVPESVTFIVNHDRPKLSASTERLELTTTVSKAKGIQLPQVRSSHIAADSQVSIAKPDVDQNLDDSFKAEAPKIPDTDYISQLTIAAERPEIKPQSEEIRVEVRKPEIIIPPPKVDLPKRGAAESMTYVVNYDDESLKVPKKAKVKTKTEKVLKDIKTKVNIPTPEGKAASKAFGAESMTYIVNYDVPEREAKFEEPQIVPTGEIITPAIKPVEPKVKIEKQFEELVIAVEHPEIRPEKPEAEISYQEPSSQLTITVEQPEIKPQTEVVKVKKPEIIIPSPEVELPKRGAAESMTYVVNYDDESLVVPKKAKVKTKTEKVAKEIKAKVNIPMPEGKAASEAFGAESMTYIVNYDVPERKAKFEEPQIVPTGEIITPAIKPVEPKVKIEKQFEELVISVEHPEISPEKPEAEISYQEPSSQLTITVEQPEIKTQTEEIAVKIKKPEIIIPSPEVELPKRGAAESMTYVVNYDDESLIVPKKAKVKTKAEKVAKEIKTKVNIPTPEVKAATEAFGAESVTYIVNYDVPERKAKFEEPQIVPTGEFITPAIKPVEPKVKIEKQFEELVIAVEHPEISPEKPEAQISYQEPSPQLTIMVEQPEIKPQTEEISVKIKKPEIIIPSPEVELPKRGAAESMTYVVNYQDESLKVPKKAKVKTKTEKVPKEIKTKVNIPTPELIAATETLGAESMTYIVNYDVPEGKAKFEEPQIVPTSIKPVEPKVKIEKQFEELVIAVEHPEIRPEKPEAEISYQEPSSELTITVEQPEIKPQTEEISVKIKKPEIIIPSAEVELPKRGAAESMTYVVNYDDDSLIVPKKAKVKTKAEKVAKEIKTKVNIPTPEVKAATEAFGAESMTYIVNYDVPGREAKLEEPQIALTSIKPVEPKVKIEKQFEELVIEVEHPEISPEKPEAEISYQEPSSELTITVEQPEIKPQTEEISVKIKKPEIIIPSAEVELPKRGAAETMTYVVNYDDDSLKVPKKAKVKTKTEKVLKEIKSKVNIPTPALNAAVETLGAESMTYIVNYDVPGREAKLEEPQTALTSIKPIEPKVKIEKQFEELVIAVEHPEISPEKPEAEISYQEPSSELTITVEQPEIKPQTEEISDKIKKPEIIIPSAEVELPKLGAAETMTYVVNYDDDALKVPKKAKVKTKTEKVLKDIKSKVNIPTPELNAAAETLGAESMTYIVNYDVPGREAKLEEPQIALTSIKPIEPKVKIEKQFEELVIAFEHPEISPEKPEAEMSYQEPSSQLTITVEQPEIKPQTEEISVKIKKPEIIIPSAEVELPKRGAAESMTYVVNYDDESLIVPKKAKVKTKAEKVAKEIKTKVNIPTPEVKAATEAFGAESMTYIVNYDVPERKAKFEEPQIALTSIKPIEPKVKIEKQFEELVIAVEHPEISPEKPEAEISYQEPSSELTITVEQPEIKPQTEEISVKIKKPELIIPSAEVELPKRGAAETMTYVVNYDDESLVVPKKAKVKRKTEKVLKDIKSKVNIPTPELNAAAETLGAESMTYIVNYDVPGREAKFEEPQIALTSIKPIEPKVKIEKQFEELVIAVEHPEISPEKPEAEISYQEPSSELTITVEQPEIKPQTEKISVKIKKPEIIIPSAEVELPKRGAAEAITYVVTYDDESLVVPKKAKVKRKTEKVLKDIKSKVNIPTPELNAAAETLGAESMTYIVNYDVPGREAKFEEPQIALTSIKPIEPKVKIEKQFEELVITVEHPEISPEKPEPEISYQEPSSELTITVEQPEIKPQTEEISVKVKKPEIIIPSPHVELPGPQAAESMTYVVDYDVPKIEEAKVPEIELVMPVEQLAISVERHIGIHEDVEPSNEKESPFSFKVERPQFEVTDEVNPESHEIALDVREPELVVSPPSLKQPKRSAAETLTYIVNYEEPLILVSKKSKPKTDKEKKLKVSAAAGDVPRSTGSPAGESGIVTPTTRVPVTAPDTGIAADASLPGEAYTKSESMTYVVEHLDEPKVKESISAEGEKKRIDWIWRVKKPGERIDLSIESKERESPRAEELSSVKVSSETPALGTVDSDVLKAPESRTYVVTYDVPSSKPTAKFLPFSIKPRPVKIKITPDKKKTGLFVKKDLPQATGKVDIELQEVEQKGEEAKEAPREDIRISIPTVPSVNVGLEPKETVSVEESDVLTLPVVPAFTADVTVAEPSVEVVVPPVETEEKELKPAPEEDAKISRKETLQFDVEAKLPGRKEQAFAEKLIGTKLKAADKDAVEKSQYQDRLIITVEEQQIEEHPPAEEEIVTYIVNYDQPSIGGSPTKPKDEAKKKETQSKPTTVPTEAEKHQAATDAYLEAQLPQQLEQCILVPLHQESSPEDSFYSAATEDESPTPTPTPTPRDRQRRRHFDNNNDDDYEEEEGEYYDDTESDLSSQKLAAAADTRWAPSPTESDRLLPPHLVVVAIDFGTTFSGYAFSFARDATGGIHVMRKWEGGDPGAVDYKTPTILLLTPDRRFHSFGFTARDFYHDLSPKESARWLYFEKFKMALHFCEKLHPSTQLAAANGEGVAAIDIFSHSLRFFRDHVLQEVSDQVSTDVLNEDIYWIITVPAIWTDEAKQFMRLAAYKAGIASPDYPDQLLIALEPEAASIYVRKQRLHQLVPEAPLQRRRSYQRRSVTPEPTAVNQPIGTPERKTHPSDGVHVVKTTTVSVNWTAKTTIPQTEVTVGHQVDTTGTRYMVVDCGGGTVDITVHEIQSRDGTLREVHRATGGPFGSVAVDQEFEKLLVEIFGSDFIEVFKAKRPAGWVDLLMAFESRKRAANPHHVKPLNVSLPFSFIDYHKKYRNCPVEYAIRKYGSRDVRWSSQGMLRLMPDAMNRLFLPAIEKIKEAIGVALNDSGIRGLRFLFLVGGFAESPMLQLAIRQEFGHLMKIIIPNDASISILKGAVCFGLDPTVVTTRKSRMTYGVGVLNRFVRGQHPASKLVVKDGEDWCTDVFDALVYADQSVAIGDTVVRRYTLVPGGDQDAAAAAVSKTVSVYSSETKDVRYVTDRGVTRCGTLELWGDGDEGGGASREEVRGREVQVRMIFGHTEIKVIAVDVRTRKTVRATIDFLNK